MKNKRQITALLSLLAIIGICIIPYAKHNILMLILGIFMCVFGGYNFGKLLQDKF